VDADRILVDTTGFRIPCRRFSFVLNVSRDRRLPVVDEFVLRLLKMFDRIPVQRLRRSEEHTSELQSHLNLVCRLLLEKKKVLQFILICRGALLIRSAGSLEGSGCRSSRRQSAHNASARYTHCWSTMPCCTTRRIGSQW